MCVCVCLEFAGFLCLCFFAMAASLASSDVLPSRGPPVCPKCRDLELAPLRQGLQEVWQEEQGLKWGWCGRVAYWKLCKECHEQAWPLDRRFNNRHSTPHHAVPWGGVLRNGVRRLVVGDFYITTPPPHLPSPTEIVYLSANLH